MTTPPKQAADSIAPKIDLKETTTAAGILGSAASEPVEELKGEELEARIAPASFSEITFTKHTSTSSP